MNETPILIPVASGPARPGTTAEPAGASPRPFDGGALQSLVAIWRERIRARWTLARMAQENPHLLEDVGLTKQQVETEIAKPFWRR